MILFLDYSAGDIRGGEIYTSRFHSFIAKRFDNISPKELPTFPNELSSPLKHCAYSYKRTKKESPRLIVVNVSSGIRNVPAVFWMKIRKRFVLTVVLEQRLAIRSDNFLVRWLVRKCENYLIRKSDIALVISEYSASLVREARKGRDVPCIIAPPGMENIGARLSEDHRKAPGPNSTIRLLFVGMCVWHKGIKYLVEGMNLLRDLNIKLDIIGKFDQEDSYYQSIDRYISENSLGDRITFHGFIEKEEVVRLFREASIYVHPSLMEGYGMVLAEAMSFGLPIVTTSICAIPELIKDGVNGILVEPGNSTVLADAIRTLISDNELFEQLSARNLQTAANLATWDDFEYILEKEMIPKIEQVTGIRAKKE